MGRLGYTMPDAVSTLRFARLGQWAVASQWVFAGGSAIWLTTGLIGLLYPASSRLRTLNLAVNALALVTVIFVWASMGRRLEILGIITQSMRLSTPIAFGALAGILCERSGVINIAIEGMMLSAACLGFTLALYTQSIWIGVHRGKPHRLA